MYQGIKAAIDNAFNTLGQEKTFTVGEMSFTFAAHTNRDEFLLVDKLSQAQENQEEAISALANARARSIAMVLRKVNGQSIPDFVERPDGTRMERVLALTEDIAEWPASLVSVLYMVAQDYKRRVRSAIRSSVSYDWFGTDLLKEQEEEESLEAMQMEKLAQERRATVLKEVKEAETPAPEASSFANPAE